MPDDDLPQLRVHIRNQEDVTVTRGNDVESGSTAHDDERLWDTLQVLRRLLRERSLKERDDYELLGSCLFDFLFTGTVRATVQQWLRDVFKGADPDHDGPILRFVLQFDRKSGDVAEMPWEYLHIRSDFIGQRVGFVATDQRLVLSRRINLPDRPPVALTPSTEQLRIFVGIASPSRQEIGPDLVPLDNVEDEAGKVAARLQRSAAAVQVDRALTRDALRDALATRPGAFRPHIVHLAAHGKYDGNNGFLALCDSEEPKLAQWTKDGDIADCFDDHAPSIVFLHACSGAQTNQIRGLRGVALSLVDTGVLAVIAMSFEIDNGTARRFAIRVYDELERGSMIDRAVQAARREIGEERRPNGNFSERQFGSLVAFVQEPGLMILPSTAVPLAATPTSPKLRCPQGHPLQHEMKRCMQCKRLVAQCPVPGCLQFRYLGDDSSPWCEHEITPVGTRAEGEETPGSARPPEARDGPTTTSSMGPDTAPPGSDESASALVAARRIVR